MAETLYYNQTTKQLLLGNKDEANLKQLDIAQYIRPESIQLHEGKYLSVWDVNKKEYIPLTDQKGDLVSLKGEKGDQGAPGINGIDGKDAIQYPVYHLDLSNDADQIYINSNYEVHSGQSAITIHLSVYKDGALSSLNDWNVIVYGDYAEVSSDGDVTISIPEKTNLKEFDQLIYTIKCVNKINANIILSKSFKLKVLLGSTDYDLVVSKSVIKVTPDGMVCEDSPQQIDVLVKARSFGHQSSVEYLTPKDLLKTDKCKVYYKYSYSNELLELTSNAIDLLDTVFHDGEYITILLYRDGDVIDEHVIECIKDGKDGKDGTNGADGQDGEPGQNAVQFVCTTGQNYYFYLNGEKKALQQDQCIHPEFVIIDGAVNQKVVAIINSPESAPLFAEDGTCCIYHNTEETYSTGVFEYTAIVEYEGREYITSFNVYVENGASSYDLTASPATIHYNPNTNTFNDVVFTVYKQCSGGGYTEQSECSAEDPSYLLQFDSALNGDDVLITDTTDDSGILKYKLSPNVDQQHIVKCYQRYEDGNLELEDFVTLPCIKDGVDGACVSLPENPELGQIITWGMPTSPIYGQKVAQGFMVQNQQYQYKCANGNGVFFRPLTLRIYCPQIGLGVLGNEETLDTINSENSYIGGLYSEFEYTSSTGGGWALPMQYSLHTLANILGYASEKDGDTDVLSTPIMRCAVTVDEANCVTEVKPIIDAFVGVQSGTAIPRYGSRLKSAEDALNNQSRFINDVETYRISNNIEGKLLLDMYIQVAQYIGKSGYKNGHLYVVYLSTLLDKPEFKYRDPYTGKDVDNYLKEYWWPITQSGVFDTVTLYKELTV